MAEHYESSAVRHYNDALLLRKETRWDNAGHLIGFAAECAIKHAISSFHSGADVKQAHLPELLVSARKLFTHRSKQQGLYLILDQNIFETWKVERRYHQTGTTTQAEVSTWISETKRLFGASQIKVKT